MNDQSEAFKSSPKNDYREYLRKNCYLPIVEPEQNTEPFGNVLNLSTSGLFMVTKGGKDQAEPLKARFFVPNVSNPINFLGKVVYVKNEGSGQFLGMGVRFLELDGEHKKALRSYILNHGFNETLSGYQKKSNSSIQNLKPFNDLDGINSIFSAACHKLAPVHIFWCGRYVFIPTRLQDVGKYHLSLKLPEGSIRDTIHRYDHLYMGMTNQGASYFFEATVKYVGIDSLTVTRPEVIYFDERRVETRYSAATNGGTEPAGIEVHVRENGRDQAIDGIVDFNSSGISFHLPLGDSFFSPGKVIEEIKIIKDKIIHRHDNARVIHVTPINHERVKIGLAFHIERQSCEFKQYDQHLDFGKEESYIYRLAKIARDSLNACESQLKRFLGLQSDVPVVKYYSKNGEEMVAILNATFDLNKTRNQIETPVIIIPPAFARRKETTGLLAMTIVETFRKFNRDVVVIRFDGIRSVGESHNDPECKKDGKEMVHHSLTQLAEDIRTTVEFAKTNPKISPTNIILVSFSMASVASRQVLAKDTEKDIDCWISCMGASDPDDLMRNSTGGIDYLMRFRNGERLFEKQVLGHMVNLDRYCQDIESNHMSTLKDARRDMAQLDIPVTWIYGKYDYWINKNRIYDIMSIRSGGLRQVYEMPCGHIVRTSDEAIDVFKLITRCIWKHLYQSDVVPGVPSAIQRANSERMEWARVRRKEMDFKNYWRSYLLGENEAEIGFDLISLTDEYNELMEKQLELLELKNKDLMIDLGGGTGNFIQCYLEKSPFGKSIESSDGPKIVMVDFVREALIRAREKHVKLIGSNSPASSGFDYVAADLDAVRTPAKLPFLDGKIDKILASLFISYVEDPTVTLKECFRVLKTGGMIILSSLKPDTDMSKPMQTLIDKIRNNEDLPYFKEINREKLLAAVQYYINSAAYLTDLEEERTFKFYAADELSKLLFVSGFTNIQMHETFGSPPQGLIAIGFKL